MVASVAAAAVVGVVGVVVVTAVWSEHAAHAIDLHAVNNAGIQHVSPIASFPGAAAGKEDDESRLF